MLDLLVHRWPSGMDNLGMFQLKWDTLLPDIQMLVFLLLLGNSTAASFPSSSSRRHHVSFSIIPPSLTLASTPLPCLFIHAEEEALSRVAAFTHSCQEQVAKDVDREEVFWRQRGSVTHSGILSNRVSGVLLGVWSLWARCYSAWLAARLGGSLWRRATQPTPWKEWKWS